MLNIKIPSYSKHLFFNKRNKYALLIPVINEGDRFISQMNKMKDSGIFNICDVYICDGGSTDNSTSLETLQNYGCKALLVNTSSIKGQGVQLKQGFYEAMKEDYDGAIMVDGNDKDDIDNSLKRFIEKLDDGYDVVQATRFSLGGYHENTPLPRMIGIRLIASPLISFTSGFKYDIDNSLKRFIEKLDDGYDVVQATRFSLGGYHENTPLPRMIGIRLIASPLISFTSGFKYDDVCNGYKGFSKRYIMDERLAWFSDFFTKYEYCYYPLVHAKKLGYKVVQVPTSRIYPKNEVPSKIKGFKSNLRLFKDIVSLAFSKIKNTK